MKKSIKVLGIVLLSIGAVFFVTALTGILHYYKSATISGHPTIKRGEIFFTSVLKEPERFDLICFHAELPFEGRSLIVQRLCGVPGDTVEIKNGILYVNSKNADKDLNLSHFYVVPATDQEQIQQLTDTEDGFIIPKDDDTLLVNFSDKAYADNKLRYRKLIVERFVANEEISKVFNKNWNADNFGPITVPADHYFVLGDNRPNSLDSRYLGFIHRKDYQTTVLFK